MRILSGYQNTNNDANTLDNTVSFDGELYSIDPNKFDPSFFTIERLALSLSKLSRYNGHIGEINEFYSVAQHSTLIADVFFLSGEIETAEQALLHDAIEAIVFGDIPTPTKRKIKEQYDTISNPLEEKLFKHYKIEYPINKEIKIVDRNLAQIEMTFGLKNKMYFDYWSIEKSYRNFINMWAKIQIIKKYKDLPFKTY